MVEDFMKKYDQNIRKYPQIPEGEKLSALTYHTENGPQTRYCTPEEALRYKLINEEAIEVMNGIAVGDLVEIADGLADLLYVTFGTALTYGIPIETIFSEVHRSNMTKTKLGHIQGGAQAGQKIQKGEYSPAKVAHFIKQAIEMREKK